MSFQMRMHDRAIREIIAGNDGHVFKALGDGFCAAFTRLSDALVAAGAIHAELTSADWNLANPLRVRMAIHCGMAEQRDNDYFGPTVNRASRLLSVAEPGKLVLSQAAISLLEDDPPPGWHATRVKVRRLKGSTRKEGIYATDLESLPRLFEPGNDADGPADSPEGSRPAAVWAGAALLIVAAGAVILVLLLTRNPGNASRPGLGGVPPGSWSQDGHDPAHTGFAASERVLSSGNVDRLALLWRAQTPSGATPRQWSSATVVAGRVYVGSSMGTWAFDAGSGRLVWHNAGTGDTTRSAPSLVRGRVYLGNAKGILFALSARQGRRLWMVSTQPGALTVAPLTSPTVVGDTAYIGSVGGSVWAYRDRGSRASLLWIADQGTRTTSPTFVNGRVYIGSGAGVQALDGKTGQGIPDWGSGSGPPGVRFSAPAVAGGRVVVSAAEGSATHRIGIVYSLDRATGRELWSFVDHGHPIGTVSQPALGGGFVYVGSSSGTLIRLDANTGHPSWTFPPAGREFGGELFWWRPTLANGVVYIGGVGRGHADVYAVRSADGTQLWHYAVKETVPPSSVSASEPVISRGRLVVTVSCARPSGVCGVFGFGLHSARHLG